MSTDSLTEHAYALARERYAALGVDAEAAIKRLVAEANGDWKFYTGGKSDFVAELVRRALDEAPPLPLHGERMPAGR